LKTVAIGDNGRYGFQAEEHLTIKIGAAAQFRPQRHEVWDGSVLTRHESTLPSEVINVVVIRAESKQGPESEILGQNLEDKRLLAAARGHPQPQARMVTGGQIRATRNLLGWSARELARRASLSVRTVHSAESTEGTPRIQLRTMEKIERAFRDAGIEFLAESQRSNGGGLGLRLRRPPLPEK
jgi:hypothetical protein